MKYMLEKYNKYEEKSYKYNFEENSISSIILLFKEEKISRQDAMLLIDNEIKLDLEKLGISNLTEKLKYSTNKMFDDELLDDYSSEDKEIEL